MSRAIEDKARNEYYQLKSNMSFPDIIQGDNLRLFVDTNRKLHPNVNDASFEFTSNQQDCKLMVEFKNHHAKSFARDDWTMIVYRFFHDYHIAIINIKEQVFAKTFSAVNATKVNDVLDLNGYRISFTTDDFDGNKYSKSSGSEISLLLNIHNSSKMGPCDSFQSDSQKSRKLKLSSTSNYLHPCPYCSKIKYPMNSTTSIFQYMLDESRQQEKIEDVAKHVLPKNRRSTLCIASLLGLNETLTKTLLYREAYNHRSLMMNMFERKDLQEYLRKLESKNITDSEEYWLVKHQVKVAKVG